MDDDLASQEWVTDAQGRTRGGCAILGIADGAESAPHWARVTLYLFGEDGTAQQFQSTRGAVPMRDVEREVARMQGVLEGLIGRPLVLFTVHMTSRPAHS